jgi:hypothetical protein
MGNIDYQRKYMVARYPCCRADIGNSAGLGGDVSRNPESYQHFGFYGCQDRPQVLDDGNFFASAKNMEAPFNLLGPQPTKVYSRRSKKFTAFEAGQSR